MEKITLKHSNLTVSRLCFGGCPLGGHGWGDVDEDELIKTIDAAVECGINFFDTADTYGLGKSESILGKALRKKRDKVVIASKFGVVVENGNTRIDNSTIWLKKALEESLKRIKTDYIDLYQIHYLKKEAELDDLVNLLIDFQKKGMIRYFGLSNISKKDFNIVLPYKELFTSFQLEYSLANRANEEDLFYLSKNLDLSPMTWGSLGQGILSGKYNEKSVFAQNDRRSREIYVNFHGDKLKKNLEIVQKARKISLNNNIPVPAIAIRFILEKIQNSIVLVGMKSRDQLKNNLLSFGWSFLKKDFEQLDRISNEYFL